MIMMMETSPSPSPEEIAAAPEIAMTVAEMNIDNPEDSNDSSKHDPSASSTSAVASASVTETAPAADGEGVVVAVGHDAPPPCTIISDNLPLPSSNANTISRVEPSSSASSSVAENIIAASPALSATTTAVTATATNPTIPATAEKPPTTNKKAATTAKSKKNKDTEEKTRKKPKTKKLKLGADRPTVTDVVGKNKSSQQQQGEITTKKKTKEKSPKGGDKSTTIANRKPPKLPMAASKKKKDKTSSLASGGVQGETDGTGGSGSGAEQNSKQQSNNSKAATTTTTTTTYSAQQAAVNDMMRRAFEEDQYSALGSIVDTDSSDDDDNYHHQERNNNNNNNYVNGGGEDDDNNNEGGSSSFRFNHRPKRSSSSSSSNGLDPTLSALSGEKQAASWIEGNNSNNRKIDRNTLMIAMRRHLRIEGTKTVRNFDKETFLEDAENYLDDVAGNSNRGGARKRSMMRGVSLAPRLSEHDSFGAAGDHGMIPEEDLATDGRKIGKRRKKRKRGKTSSSSTQQPDYASGGAAESLRMAGTCNGADVSMSGSGNDDDDDEDDVWENNNNIYSAPMDTTSNTGAGANYYDQDDDLIGEEEEISIFGQTTGSSNATWVECDRCKKWRRLRGVVDARKLPTRWFCSMNKNDPNRARCSAPEEEYDSSSAPESAVDQRTRKHLRVWVRRLHCNEAYENRQRSSKKRAAAALLSMTAKEPYEWIRCCNPACGKWRMLLRSMDASSIIDKCNGGEWYCVMNTWDEKTASCGAAQENLPSVGCPPWVLVDTED